MPFPIIQLPRGLVLTVESGRKEVAQDKKVGEVLMRTGKEFVRQFTKLDKALDSA